MGRASDPKSGVKAGDRKAVAAAVEVLSGQSKKAGLARLWPFLGPAFVACVAYIDPGNFATNLEGGAQVRLHAALGRGGQQPDGHADPDPVRQAGHRHGQEPGRALPRALSPLADLRDVGPDGSGRHGHRPGRVPGRGAGLLPAVRHAALDRRAGHGRGHLRDPRPGALRLPLAGGGDHGHGRRGRGLLPDRAGPGPARLGPGAVPRGRAAVLPAPRACCWPPASWARP